MAGGAEHPGILYFYSESIGLGANGACAFIAALVNFGIAPGGSISTGVLFLAVGGVIQLLCSFRAFRSYDHFGATVFGFYSAFWALLGLEIVLSSSIHLLHIALLIVGVLLIVVAPLVSAYHTILVGTIAVASSLELALRLVDESSALEVTTALSELVVVLATSYGCCAAVLHGIHERQILPGFDDALIETVLWKRGPLKSTYSDGKWANPSPLGSLCCAMGFAGMAARSQYDSWDVSNLWFATFSVIIGFVSLLHWLRHERLWAVSTFSDACLFALLAVDNSTYDSAKGGIFLAFVFIRLYIFGFSIAERFALVHMVTFLLEVISLLAIGVESFVAEGGGVASDMLFYVTSASAVYCAIADLANAIAQKELFPMGEGFKSWICKKKGREKRGALIRDHSAIKYNAHTKNDEETETGGRSVRRRSSLTNRLSQYVIGDNIDLEEEKQTDPMYPGDQKLIGYSDFQSPLFVMFMGTSLYSCLMSIGMFANSEQAILDAAFVLLVTYISSLLICASRGNTSFGFLSFAYLLQGMVCVVDYYSGNKSYQNLILVLILHIVWLLSSYGEFRFLSTTTVSQLFGLLFYTLSKFMNGNNALQVVAGVFFTLTSIASLTSLGLLLASHKSLLCRLLLQHSSVDTEELCDIGFASDRAQFDECIRILKGGGVCCIPTDTVYCLACTANSPDAIKRIYDIKSRPAEKPLSLWLGSISDIKEVSPEGQGWSPKLWNFMEAIWPGSVSLVVSRGDWLQRLGVGSSADLIGTAESIALRVPNSTLTVALLKETGPLAITSANPSGLCDCTHHNKVDAIIAGKIDFILADGASPMTIASSVVDVRNLDNDELFFYRVGCVPEEYIWDLLNNTKSDAEPMLAVDLHSVNAHTQIIKSFMSHIIKLVGCDAYRVYLLTSDNEGDGPSSDTTSTILKTPWTELTPRVQSAFQSGTSYYDGESEVTEKQSQMVVPLRDTAGKIIAVLELMKKVANAGQYISFKSDDLTYASLVSALLSENISTKVVSPLAQEMKAVVLSERGYRQAGPGLDIQSMHKPPRDRRGSFTRRSSWTSVGGTRGSFTRRSFWTSARTFEDSFADS